jgi:hypothetical protein
MKIDIFKRSKEKWIMRYMPVVIWKFLKAFIVVVNKKARGQNKRHAFSQLFADETT